MSSFGANYDKNGVIVNLKVKKTVFKKLRASKKANFGLKKKTKRA